VQADSYDQFVETVELLANAPFDTTLGDEVVLVSGSGGSAAVAADCLDAAGMTLATLDIATAEKLKAILPEFASPTNPIDATGVVYDDPALLPALFEAIFAQPGRPIVGATVNVAPVDRLRRIAGAIADAARASGRTVVAYQSSPLGPLDDEIVRILHSANVPLLLGIQNAMGALKQLKQRRHYALRAASGSSEGASPVVRANHPMPQDFLSARNALAAAGVPIVEASLATSPQDAAAIIRQLGQAVALKAEASGLLHKSDLGCVKLNCRTEDEVIIGYDSVIASAKAAGFTPDGVLVQPMVSGVAECFAGIIDDPLYGPAIVFGLGGIFVELLRETVTEMAPLTTEDAMRMIRRIKGAQILTGARGRPPGDVDGLAKCLVDLGRFAVVNAGRFHALDLNPIIVKPKGEGVVAVDIAIEPVAATHAGQKP
jgi:acetyltransferase